MVTLWFLLKHKEAVYSLRTSFSGGLIHTWWLVSIWGSRTVYLGMTQNNPQCVFMVKKEHVQQCGSLILYIMLWIHTQYLLALLVWSLLTVMKR